MRVYDGSPRQNWEEVLRSIGAGRTASSSRSSSSSSSTGGSWSRASASRWAGNGRNGTFAKQTHELTDDQVGDPDRRGQGEAAHNADHAEVGITNFYEQALRIVGKWLDGVQPRDVFFEQGGSFVVRAFIVDAHGKSATSCPNSRATRSWL